MENTKVRRKRSKFGKFIDQFGIKQTWVASISGLSEGRISQLAKDQAEVPNLKSAARIIKSLRRKGYDVDLEDFWKL